MVNNKAKQMEKNIHRGIIKAGLHLLGRRFGMTKIVREYIAEAEHLDGVEYWDQFATKEIAWEDVRVYKQNM